MVSIRPATDADQSAIAALLQQYMAEKGIEAPSDTVELTVGYLVSNPAYDVVVADDEIHGAIATVTVARFPQTGSDLPEYFLENLFVNPDFRDAHIGKQLIEFAIAHCSPAMATSVAVQDVQTTGQWFVDQGFQACDARQETAIVDALQNLPLKRGAEGPLQYFVHRIQ